MVWSQNARFLKYWKRIQLWQDEINAGPVSLGRIGAVAEPIEYEILVQGKLDARWSDWFDGLSVVETEDGDTLLKGEVTDQAALRGILEKIWNLNLALISVQRGQPRPYHGRT